MNKKSKFQKRSRNNAINRFALWNHGVAQRGRFMKHLFESKKEGVWGVLITIYCDFMAMITRGKDI